MKAYQISAEQIAAVTAALFLEVLSTEFSRQVGAIARAGWTPAAPLGDGGLDLAPEEQSACLARAGAFFGAPDLFEKRAPGAFGDVIGAIGARIAAGLVSFRFTAAGGHGRDFNHPADRIFGEAAALANLLYGRRRIVSLVAPHSLLGFSLSVLAPNLLGLPSIDARTIAPEELQKALSFGDAVIATPSLWRYLLAQGVKAPDNAMAVTFGEALSPELSAEIRKAGYGAQREIYGSTESGLVGWRDTPSDPFALFEFWRRNGGGRADGLHELGERPPLSPRRPSRRRRADRRRQRLSRGDRRAHRRASGRRRVHGLAVAPRGRHRPACRDDHDGERRRQRIPRPVDRRLVPGAPPAP